MKQWIHRALKVTVITFSAYYIVIYLVVALIRLSYPFELEWMEGGMVAQVRWLMQGNQFYTKPTVHHVPYIYTPLYYWLSVLLSKLMGAGFAPMRLISVVSSLGVFFLTYLFIRKETNSKYYAIMGVGLFAATYEIGGAWLDIARVDSLFTFLLLLAVYGYSRSDDTMHAVIAGVIFCCAFLAKQSGLVFVFVFLVLMSARESRRALVCLTVFLALAAAVGISINIASNGWFYFYVIRLPQSHLFLWDKIVQMTAGDFMPLTILIGFIVYSLCRGPFSRMDALKRLDRSSVLLFAFLCGMVTLSISSRLHDGGDLNVNIPAYLGITLAGTMFVSRFSSDKMNFTLSLVVLQFLLLLYNPVSHIPSRADKSSGNDFIEYVSGINGNVLITAHSYYGHLAGKGVLYAHGMAIGDVFRADIDKGIKDDLLLSIADELGKSVSVVITSEGCDYSSLDVLLKDYGKNEKITYPDGDVFIPVAGCKSRPANIYYLPSR